MQTWIDFWTFFFWITLLSFLLNPKNFILLLFYSELVWVTLYCYTVMMGGITDDINLFSLSFFFLGLAGLEFSFGFLLIIAFKNINKSLEFFDEKKIWEQFLIKKNINLFLNKYSYKN